MWNISLGSPPPNLPLFHLLPFRCSWCSWMVLILTSSTTTTEPVFCSTSRPQPCIFWFSSKLPGFHVQNYLLINYFTHPSAAYGFSGLAQLMLGRSKTANGERKKERSSSSSRLALKDNSPVLRPNKGFCGDIETAVPLTQPGVSMLGTTVLGEYWGTCCQSEPSLGWGRGREGETKEKKRKRIYKIEWPERKLESDVLWVCTAVVNSWSEREKSHIVSSQKLKLG